MKNKIFIDTDMGLDDVIAIAMLLSCSEYEITGFSTVNGVSKAHIGANNLMSLLKNLKLKIEVMSGSENALLEKNTSFPIIDRLRAENFFINKNTSKSYINNPKIEDYIYTKFEQKQILITFGPLTNIALTILKYGDKFSQQVKRIYLMGGGINFGNVPNTSSEYNIWLDPEAAKIVFESGIPITMVGIDSTLKAPASQNFKSKIIKASPKNKLAKLIQQIVAYNQNDFNYFYDPLLSAIIINKKIIKIKKDCSITVSLGNERGRTKILSSGSRNVEIVMDVNSDLFYENLLQKVSLQ